MKPLNLIRHSAYDIYLFHHNIIIPPSPSPDYYNQNVNNNNVLNHVNSIIDSALICDNEIKLFLSSIAITFSQYTNFEFYSDGSSESLAILTILITLPPHATCKIYTDSQNCIDTFNSRLNSSIGTFENGVILPSIQEFSTWP
ncbi:hypothetical protein RhiirA5_430862 [Rhizophagus irregularis]|uniref:RNase H type-1 domain-containing protein n=1 Tax=Rhizophagus irregularis TaxID=588596 RepID=A0A2N0NW08_9GLOM|nr:hypothetical protein RhiirA5_430862 [Rhizophagus irregularis]